MKKPNKTIQKVIDFYEQLLKNNPDKEAAENILKMQHSASDVKEALEYINHKPKEAELNWPVLSTNAQGEKIPITTHPDNFEFLLKQLGVGLAMELGQKVIKNQDTPWKSFEEEDFKYLLYTAHKLGFVPKREAIRDWIDVFAARTKDAWLADYLTTKWNGVDHVLALYNTLDSQSKDDEGFELMAFRKAIQGLVVMVLQLKDGNQLSRNELMILLVGQEGAGKTAWCRKLVVKLSKNIGVLHEGCIDTRGKDNILRASRILLWVASEFEQSVKKNNIGTLKDFLTASEAMEREVYHSSASAVIRRCSFIGSTNQHKIFPPGEELRRFIPIDVGNIDYEHDIDLKQLYSQVIDEWKGGFKHWWTGNQQQQNTKRISKWVIKDSLDEFMACCQPTYFSLEEKVQGVKDFDLWEQYVDFCKEYILAQSHRTKFNARLKQAGFCKIGRSSSGASYWNLIFDDEYYV